MNYEKKLKDYQEIMKEEGIEIEGQDRTRYIEYAASNIFETMSQLLSAKDSLKNEEANTIKEKYEVFSKEKLGELTIDVLYFIALVVPNMNLERIEEKVCAEDHELEEGKNIRDYMVERVMFLGSKKEEKEVVKLLTAYEIFVQKQLEGTTVTMKEVEEELTKNLANAAENKGQ